MSDHCCPACESNDIVMIDDFERDLTILRCRVCGEMFAVTNKDAYINGKSWVFGEWENSFASQKRLCGACELVETYSYSNANETIHVLECSECGRTCEHVNGSYPRCPYCGAKAIDKEVST